jgi:hypothetical protein
MPAQIEPTEYYDETKSNSKKLRPDVAFSKGFGTILVDVTVVHPTSAGRVSAHTGPIKPLAAADKKAKEKSIKYSTDKLTESAKQYNVQFIPFVVETYGGIHSQGEQLLLSIASSAVDYSSIYSVETIHQQLRADIAIDVQRGNAIAIMNGGEPRRIIASNEGSLRSTLERNSKSPSKKRIQPANQNLIHNNNNSNNIPIVMRNPVPSSSSSSLNQQTLQHQSATIAPLPQQHQPYSVSLSVRDEANQLLDSIDTSILMHSAHVNYVRGSINDNENIDDNNTDQANWNQFHQSIQVDINESNNNQPNTREFEKGNNDNNNKHPTLNPEEPLIGPRLPPGSFMYGGLLWGLGAF